MSDVIGFGFEQTGERSRLVLRVPTDVVGLAFEHDKTLEERIKKLQTRKYLAIDRTKRATTIGLNARAIGRLTDKKKKPPLYEVLNGAITGLVEAQPLAPPQDQPGLFVQRYRKLPAGRFDIAAHVAVPDVRTNVLRKATKHCMKVFARELDYFNDKDYSTRSIDVVINDTVGIELIQDPISKLTSEGGGEDVWSRDVQLSGIVHTLHEPVIYLAGLTVLAGGAELVKR